MPGSTYSRVLKNPFPGLKSRASTAVSLDFLETAISLDSVSMVFLLLHQRSHHSFAGLGEIGAHDLGQAGEFITMHVPRIHARKKCHLRVYQLQLSNV